MATWTTNNWSIGKRVELHPATDRWMMGDRYGVIVKVKCDSRYTLARIESAKIRLDKSDKTFTFPINRYEVIE